MAKSSIRDRDRIAGRLAIVLLAALLAGCGAHRPLQGIPAAKLADELRHPITYRSGRETIDLSLLRRTPPQEHRVDSGDVLGVFIEGILGGDGQVPPVYIPQDISLPPSLGYPVAVLGDSTISLPGYEPIKVGGLTLRQVEGLIREVCTSGERPLLRQGNERIIVTLQRPRAARVLVIRQEDGNAAGNAPQAGDFTNREKRGTGRIVALPVYRNDVLHALAETGGLPGLDAENVIYVIRGSQRPSAVETPPPAPETTMHRRAGGPIRLVSGGIEDPFLTSELEWASRSQSSEPDLPTGHSTVMEREQGISRGRGATRVAGAGPGATKAALVADAQTSDSRIALAAAPSSASRMGFDPFCGSRCETPTVTGPGVVRIPLRLLPGECPQFTEEDITLRDGDVVFVETREIDFFMTGGLLGGAQYPLPRDYDITVIDAIAMAEQAGSNANRLTRSLGGVSALNQDVTVGASKVVLLRKTPGCGEVPIEIDLYKAIRNPHERVIIQAGDRIVLQYTRMEAVAAFFERHILDGAVIGLSSAAVFSN